MIDYPDQINERVDEPETFDPIVPDTKTNNEVEK